MPERSPRRRSRRWFIVFFPPALAEGYFMNAECLRIAGQLRHAFEGGAWHGSAVMELLQGVGSVQAQPHLVRGTHSIVELVMHIGLWEHGALDAIKRAPLPKTLPPHHHLPSAPHSHN